MSQNSEAESVGAEKMENGVDQNHKAGESEQLARLTKELQEELILTSSLTHIVAEKTSEIEHLKGKISEQDGRIRNLEDQIEEWTNQAEVCDKLLEQKDCEIEMLKKTLNIEKQQRRDLEDMVMESGRESLKEKEQLEQKIIELETCLQKLSVEKKGGESDKEQSGCKGDNNDRVGDESAVQNVIEPVVSAPEKTERVEAEVTKEELFKDEKQSQEIEELMSDMFELIKQNEDLKEEIEKLKTENMRILESKREVITDLEKNLDEKSAENQRQRHEIRRMSSTIELAGMEVNPEKEDMMRTWREDYAGRVEECEFLSAELKAKSDVSDAEKEAYEKEIALLTKKLEMEREQNIELNKKILEVSNLYDNCYGKCEEMERSLGERQFDEMKYITGTSSPNTNAMIDKFDVHGELEVKVAGEDEDMAANETTADDITYDNEEQSAVDNSFDEKTEEVIPHQEKQTRDAFENDQISTPEKTLNTAVRVVRLITIVSLTALLIFVVRYVYHVEFVYAITGLAVIWLLFYNALKLLRPRTEKDPRTKDKKIPDNYRKLRRALQDAISRLDNENFLHFSEIYDRFISDTDEMSVNELPYDLQQEIRYLKASKTILEKELQNLRERNEATNKDFMLMKRDVDALRVKRLNESEEQEKTIAALKEELKRLESQKSDKEFIEVNESKEATEMTIREKSFYVKYLLIVFCGCLCAVYINDYTALPIITMLFVSVFILMYKTDTALEYANSNMNGYQKTVKYLLSNVEKYKKEEKQVAKELKEMESVVDKDYEIITKQRQAIERLERQLQRAIRKYQEKKRLTLRFQWLENRGFGSNRVEGDISFDKDISDSVQEKSVYKLHNKTGRLESQDASSMQEEKLSDAKSLKNNTNTNIRINIATLAVLLFVGFAAWYSDFLVGLDTSLEQLAYNYIRVLTPVFGAMFVIVALSQLSRLRKKAGNDINKEQQELSYNDEQMLNEHVDTLRGLLSTEREVITKLESEVEVNKISSMNAIPSSEINAVIDKLIELSRQKDELQITADTTKNKYDNVKRTLEDILSREKYLSEEVANLRSQKRELQNDLMKEQIKHIDMFEEIKKLQPAGDINTIENNLTSEQQFDVMAQNFSYEDFDEESHSTDHSKRKKKKVKIHSKKKDSKNGDEEVSEEEEGKNDANKMSGNVDASTAAYKNDAVDTTDEDNTSAGENESKRYASTNANTSDVDDASDAENASDAVDAFDDDVDTIKNNSGDQNTDARAIHGKEALKIELICLQDELTKERLRNFELSEKISVLEIEKQLEKCKARVEHGADDPAEGHIIPADEETTSDSEHLGKTKVSQEEKQRFERQDTLLNAKDRQLQELREIINFINDNRTKQQQMELNEVGKRQSNKHKSFEFQALDKEKFSVELHRLGHEILRLKEICEGDLKILGMGQDAQEPMELVQYLTEQIGVFRYLISSDKTAVTAKMNAMEEKAEELGRQLVCLNNDIEKEKLARNHLIKEYEDEYERLEYRLTEAYENIRKRLTEERVMRGQIMKQYEREIEEIQNKTEEILKELRHQLKHERKEKEAAEYKAEMIMKKLKTLEMELEMIEDKNKSEVDFDLLLSAKYDGDRDVNRNSDAREHDIEQFKKAVDEETSNRTRKLKEKLDQAVKDIANYQNRLRERETVIDRLQRQETAYKKKIDVQDKRMKDLEHEVRANASINMESTLSDENRCFTDSGIINQLSTKNGTSTWENPAITGVIQVSRSSAGFGNASDILDTQAFPCSTEDLEGSWFSVDFGEEIAVIPETYSLWHGWMSGDACLRSWVLEGSMDASQWYTIQKHTRDTTLSERYSVGTWKISETHRPFRHLRIRMTGKNSSNTNELYLNGFEVFGKIVRS